MEEEGCRGSACFSFVQVMQAMSRTNGMKFSRKWKNSFESGGNLQGLIDSIKLESPLPIPKSADLRDLFAGSFSHAMVKVIGRETEPQLPSLSKVEKFFSESILRAFSTAWVWALPTWWVMTNSGSSGVH